MVWWVPLQARWDRSPAWSAYSSPDPPQASFPAQARSQVQAPAHPARSIQALASEVAYQEQPHPEPRPVALQPEEPPAAASSTQAAYPRC